MRASPPSSSAMEEAVAAQDGTAMEHSFRSSRSSSSTFVSLQSEESPYQPPVSDYEGIPSFAMEEEVEAEHGTAMDCYSRSFSSSSSNFVSFQSHEPLYHAPMSECEEIPSYRWLSASFFPASKSKPNPSPPNKGAAMKASSAGYPELDLFQTHVADRLQSLVSDDGEAAEEQSGRQRRPLVSLCFLRRLLEAFVCIEEEFKALLWVMLDRDAALVRRAPVGRLVGDFVDRAVRSLDVCNAIAHALDSLQFCQRYAEIAASALRPGPAAPAREARFHRARRALSNLLALLGPDQLYLPQGTTKERTWRLFGSSSGAAASKGDVGSGDAAASRSVRRRLSLNMSQNWSAAKQVETMLANFAPPRGADATALAMAVYAMSAVTVLVVWTLVLSFPCQGQGGHGPSSVAAGAARSLAPPWQAPWAAPMVALQERIAEECRRDRKDSPGARAPLLGLLAELQSLARCGRAVVEVGGGVPGFPMEDRQWEEVGDVGRELAATCRAMEEQLGPLQVEVREVFHRVLLSPAEVLVFLSLDGQEPLSSSMRR